jgi:hypothetical protein
MHLVNHCNHVAIAYLEQLCISYAKISIMLLELLNRLILITTSACTLAWAAAVVVEPAAATLALTSLTLTLAVGLLSANLAIHARLVTPSRSSLALLAWLAAAPLLTHWFFQTKILWNDLGFFSPATLIVCWISTLTLWLARNNPSARRNTSR